MKVIIMERERIETLWDRIHTVCWFWVVDLLTKFSLFISLFFFFFFFFRIFFFFSLRAATCESVVQALGKFTHATSSNDTSHRWLKLCTQILLPCAQDSTRYPIPDLHRAPNRALKLGQTLKKFKKIRKRREKTPNKIQPPKTKESTNVY